MYTTKDIFFIVIVMLFILLVVLPFSSVKAADVVEDELMIPYIVEVKENLYHSSLTIEGYRISQCYGVGEVEWRYQAAQDGQSERYIIYPTMRQLYDFCPRKMTPIEYNWSLPKEILDSLHLNGTILLQIKTCAGDDILHTISDK